MCSRTPASWAFWASRRGSINMIISGAALGIDRPGRAGSRKERWGRRLGALPRTESFATPNLELARLSRVVKERKYVYSEKRVGRGNRNVTNALGEKIGKLRKKKGFTLENPPGAASPSKSYIGELENKDPP